LGYRFSFNSVDFEERVTAAAVRLGLVAGPELDEEEAADLVELVERDAIETPRSALGEYLVRHWDALALVRGESLVYWLKKPVVPGRAPRPRHPGPAPRAAGARRAHLRSSGGGATAAAAARAGAGDRRGPLRDGRGSDGLAGLGRLPLPAAQPAALHPARARARLPERSRPEPQRPRPRRRLGGGGRRSWLGSRRPDAAAAARRRRRLRRAAAAR